MLYEKESFPDAIHIDDETNDISLVVYRSTMHPLKPSLVRLAQAFSRSGVRSVVEYNGKNYSFDDFAAGRLGPRTVMLSMNTINQYKSNIRKLRAFVSNSTPDDPDYEYAKTEQARLLQLLPEKERQEFKEEDERNAASDARLQKILDRTNDVVLENMKKGGVIEKKTADAVVNEEFFDKLERENKERNDDNEKENK